MKGSHYKWWALVLLWVAFFLQQGTRQLLYPSIPSICTSFGVDRVTVGVVGTVFAMTYGLSVPFAGFVANLFSRKLVVAVCVAVFCGGIFLSGFVSSVGFLIVTYGILNGFGQTFYYPSATSLIAQLHTESRATAMSILQIGLYVGIVGCGGLAGWVAAQGTESWRWPFWILGGIGLVWAGVLAVFLKNTKPESTAQEGRPSVGEAMKAVFSKPVALCVIAGLALQTYVDIGFRNWMPSYLIDTFQHQNSSLVQWAGLHAVLWFYLGALMGILFGSRLGDRMVKRRPGIRFELEALGMMCATPFIVWMANAETFVTCCVAMGLFGFFRGVYDSNFMASFFDVVTPRYHAFGVGVMMCIAFLFGSPSSTVLPWLQGILGQSTGIASLAAFYLLGALLFVIARILFLKTKQQN